jgi:hypothetical protein
MGKENKKKLTSEEILVNLRNQLRETEILYYEIRGGIKVLEQIKSDDDEKTD